MKDRSCGEIAQIVNAGMIYIVWLTGLLFGEMLMKRSPGFVCALALAGIIAFCFFLRKTVGHFAVYLLLHLLPFGALLAVPFEAGKIELYAIYVLFFILDMAYWMKKKTGGYANIPIAMVVLNAAAYLYSDVKKNTGAMILFFALGIVYFLFYYVRLYFGNAANLAGEKTQDEKMPFGDMLKNSAVVAVPFVLLSVLAMVLIRIDALDKYALIAYDFIMRIVGRVARIVLLIIEWFASLIVVDDSETLTRSVLEFGMEEQNVVLRVISAIVYLASLGLLLFLLVRVVIAVIRWIPMHRNLKPQVIEESDMVEIRERIVRTTDGRGEKLSKIRKKYKKTVERAAKRGYKVEGYHTPKERAADLIAKTGEDIRELSGMYELERYR